MATNPKPIHIKKSNQGKLRSTLGAKKGHDIPTKSLQSALKSTHSPAERKRIQFALNARKWKH